jgi:hypothetical protein
MTLSLSPAMSEAIEFKEYLTGKALWADEARMSTVRWSLQRLMMNEMGMNVNTIAPPYRPADAADLPDDVTEAMGIGPDYAEPIVPIAPAVPEADEPVAEAVVPAAPAGPDADEPTAESMGDPATEPAMDDSQIGQADAAADEPFVAACDMVLAEPVVVVAAQE